MANAANKYSPNALARMNIAGQHQVGGPIGWRDILNQIATDPTLYGVANFIANVAPVSGEAMAYQDTVNALAQPADTGVSEFGRVAGKAKKGGEVGLNALGLLPFVPAGLGTIAGPLAKTANKKMLELAQKLKGKGANEDDIYQKTGWWLGHPDGVPRFEIDDSMSRTRGVEEDKLTHGNIWRSRDVLEHDDLYAAYPSVGGVQTIGNPPGGYDGAYLPLEDRIENSFSRTGGENMGRFRSTQLHELQHAIQGREKMASGGSIQAVMPDLADIRYKKSELDFKLQQSRAAASDEARLLVSRKDPESTAFTERAYKKWVGILGERSDKNPFGVDKQQAVEFEILDTKPAHKSLVEEYNRVFHEAKEEPYDRYRRLAGEAEARLVQKRMNMTMEDRLKNPFYKDFDVPLDEQIIRR